MHDCNITGQRFRIQKEPIILAAAAQEDIDKAATDYARVSVLMYVRAHFTTLVKKKA